MAWQTSYDDDLRVVEARYEGRLDAAELRQAAEATLALGAKWGVSRFLGDCVALEGGHSALDLFGILERLQAADELPRGWKQAVLMPSSADGQRDVDFWETLCRNRGINVRIFSDRAAAVEWLLGGSHSS